MRYVKLFDWFREDDIHTICDKYGIEKYTINPDGSIDVSSQVSLYNKKLDKLPLKFGKINGGFDCSYNKLTTLEGSPAYTYDYYFDCSYNLLTTLEGAPKYIGGDFYCYRNKLLTFEGAPNHINHEFLCGENPIWEIWLLFHDYSKIELLNDYDALRIENGQGICILSRLNGFLEDIGKPKVTDEQIEEIRKHYEIR